MDTGPAHLHVGESPEVHAEAPSRSSGWGLHNARLHNYVRYFKNIY